ncbi:hypothetical protein D3C80_1180760 [compost metagenome]
MVFAGTPAACQEEQLITHLTVLVTSIHDLPHAHPVVERVPLKIRGLRKVAKKTEETLRAGLLFQGKPPGISLDTQRAGRADQPTLPLGFLHELMTEREVMANTRIRCAG